MYAFSSAGIFYEVGKEPGPGQEPKLHLLIESNEEFRVKLAVDELRRILLDASVAALVSIFLELLCASVYCSLLPDLLFLYDAERRESRADGKIQGGVREEERCQDMNICMTLTFVVLIQTYVTTSHQDCVILETISMAHKLGV